MRASALYLTLLLAAGAAAQTTYTSGDDFFNALPTCIKDCNAALIGPVQAECGSSLACVCEAIDNLGNGSSSSNTTATDAADACSRACPDDDKNTLTKVSMEFAASCVQYITGDDGATNSTSTMSGVSGMTAATSAAASATGTGTGTASSGASTTTTGSATPSGTGAAQTGAAAVLAGSLLAAAVPALVAAAALFV